MQDSLERYIPESEPETGVRKNTFALGTSRTNNQFRAIQVILETEKYNIELSF